MRNWNTLEDWKKKVIYVPYTISDPIEEKKIPEKPKKNEAKTIRQPFQKWLIYLYVTLIPILWYFRYEMEGMGDYNKTIAIIIALFVKNLLFPTKKNAKRFFYLFHLVIAIILNFIAISFASSLYSWTAHILFVLLFFWTIRLTYFSFFTFTYQKFDFNLRLLLSLLIFTLLVFMLKFNFVFY